MRPGTLFVLTGPSGAGKTTVAKRLLDSRPGLSRVVTCTTRAPRSGERDGIDYHFLGEDAFRTLIAEDGLYEWAKVYENFYGSRKADVDALRRAGRDVLMVIDVQGARTVKAMDPSARVVFLTVGDERAIFRRLRGRDGHGRGNQEERLAAVREELAFAKDADLVVENRDGALEETVAAVSAFMDQA